MTDHDVSEMSTREVEEAVRKVREEMRIELDEEKKARKKAEDRAAALELEADKVPDHIMDELVEKQNTIDAQQRELARVAEDAAAPYGQHEVYTDHPAMDVVQAARWARGLLLCHNRTAEELTVGMEFNPGMTAMTRIDIESPTDADGQWLIDEVKHDFFHKKSKAKLLRCINTIG